MEDTMNIRIAILAVFASTLAMAQADTAQANYSDTAAAKNFAKAADVGAKPTIVLAQSIISTSRSNIKRPSKKAGSNDVNSALGDVSITRGKLPKNNSGGLGNSGPANAPVNTSRSNKKHPTSTVLQSGSTLQIQNRK